MNSKTIGIIGGGQLGLMIIEEAHKVGAKCVVLDPSSDCPCSKIADEFIIANYDDYDALCNLGNQSDVITYEFENVPSDILIDLQKKYNFKQGIKPLFDSQDRLREKQNAINNGLTPARFFNIENLDDLNNAINELGYPCIYKTRTLGYDGHGQVVLRSSDDISKVHSYLNGLGIVEEFINFDYEISVVLVRDKEDVISFPIGQNIHKDGILDLSIVPASMDEELKNRIVNKSIEFIKSCNYEGILTIEYFIKGNEFYFNEMAPRPHNSAHYTIEGCNTNQFRELVNYLLDNKLTTPVLLNKTIMKNILGRDLDWIKNIDEGFVHLYNKTEARELRKMGHYTITDCDLERYLKLENKFKGI